MLDLSHGRDQNPEGPMPTVLNRDLDQSLDPRPAPSPDLDQNQARAPNRGQDPAPALNRGQDPSLDHALNLGPDLDPDPYRGAGAVREAAVAHALLADQGPDPNPAADPDL